MPPRPVKKKAPSKQCVACGGTGKATNGSRCYPCNGTGQGVKCR